MNETVRAKSPQKKIKNPISCALLEIRGPFSSAYLYLRPWNNFVEI